MTRLPEAVRADLRPARRSVVRLGLAVAVCVFLVAAGAGVGVASPGNQGRSCPGENPNVGLENANVAGAINSEKGIVTAAGAIGCSLEGVTGP